MIWWNCTFGHVCYIHYFFVLFFVFFFFVLFSISFFVFFNFFFVFLNSFFYFLFYFHNFFLYFSTNTHVFFAEDRVSFGGLASPPMGLSFLIHSLVFVSSMKFLATKVMTKAA